MQPLTAYTYGKEAQAKNQATARRAARRDYLLSLTLNPSLSPAARLEALASLYPMATYTLQSLAALLTLLAGFAVIFFLCVAFA